MCTCEVDIEFLNIIQTKFRPRNVRGASRVNCKGKSLHKFEWSVNYEQLVREYQQINGRRLLQDATSTFSCTALFLMIATVLRIEIRTDPLEYEAVI